MRNLKNYSNWTLKPLNYSLIRVTMDKIRIVFSGGDLENEGKKSSLCCCTDAPAIFCDSTGARTSWRRAP